MLLLVAIVCSKRHFKSDCFPQDQFLEKSNDDSDDILGRWNKFLLTLTFPLTLNRFGIRPGERLNLRGWTIVTLRAARPSEALLRARRQQPSGFGRGSEGDTGWCQPSENSSSMFDNENDMFIHSVAQCWSSNCVPVELWHIQEYYMLRVLCSWCMRLMLSFAVLHVKIIMPHATSAKSNCLHFPRHFRL